MDVAALDPDLVPVRMLNEYAYCPRLAYLEWVQGEFQDSADTVQGRLRHRRVDEEGGTGLPASDAEVDGGRGCPDASTREGGPVSSRSLMLSAPNERLIARIDVVEAHGRIATPVDYKRGAVPNTPERAWEPDRVQVCAQGLILRENGYRSDYGVLYFVESKTRVEVPFTDHLIARTREYVHGLREMAASGRIPPPLVDSPKCERCSLNSICLPDEIRLLREGHEEAAHRPKAARPHLVPPQDEGLPVYVQAQGAALGKRDDRLVVRHNGETLQEIRLLEVSQVNVIGNVQVSAQLVRELADRSIPLCHYTYGGWFSAITTGMPHKNVELRMRQFEVAADGDRSLVLARAFVAGKIRNARILLRRNHPDNPTAALDQLRRLIQRVRRATSAAELLGIEGTAAREYFSRFGEMLRAPRDAFDFEQRNRRPPRDPVNAMLSMAYSLLVKDLTIAVLAAGFDPYLGFYHRPRYGRPALALDLAEEFRPLIADSVVLAVVNRGEVDEGDFIRRGEACALSSAGRRRFIEAYERRMETVVRHPLFGYSVSYRRIIAIQARLLARFLLGEVDAYPPFVTR